MRSPEVDLILACARLDIDALPAARAARAVAAGVDWERLWAIGEAHHVLPLLDWHASRDVFPAPPPMRARLRTFAGETARRGLAMTAELLALAEGFDARGIRMVPLKGPVLAHAVYGSVALRRVRDLDILVDDAEITATLAILEARGYRRTRQMPRPEQDVQDGQSHHISLRRPAGGFIVEVHNSLLPPTGGRRYGMGLVAPHLRRQRFMGTEIWTLGPEETFAYLCHHGASHAWSRIEWIATASALDRALVRDDARAEEMAELLGGRARLAAARALAHELFGPGAPARRVPRATSAANAAVIARLDRAPEDAYAGYAERLAYQLQTDAGAGARLRRVRTLLTPQVADMRALPLPRAAWPLYYLFRPLRLLARSITRLAGGDPDRPEAGNPD